MTDRHDFSGKPSKSGGEDGCYREKFRNFVVWAEPDPKNSSFRIFQGTLPLSCAQPTGNSFTFYPKPMVEMLSRDSEDMPFASLESLWPGIW